MDSSTLEDMLRTALPLLGCRVRQTNGEYRITARHEPTLAIAVLAHRDAPAKSLRHMDCFVTDADSADTVTAVLQTLFQYGRAHNVTELSITNESKRPVVVDGVARFFQTYIHHATARDRGFTITIPKP